MEAFLWPEPVTATAVRCPIDDAPVSSGQVPALVLAPGILTTVTHPVGTPRCFSENGGDFATQLAVEPLPGRRAT